MKNIVKIIKEEIFKLGENNKTQERTRIRRLPANASIDDKIKMWRLIGEKAWNLYNSRKHSEAWIYAIHNKYAPYWEELYNEIRNTPEFTEYRKLNHIAGSLHFGDMLA